MSLQQVTYSLHFWLIINNIERLVWHKDRNPKNVLQFLWVVDSFDALIYDIYSWETDAEPPVWSYDQSSQLIPSLPRHSPPLCDS